MKKYELTTEIDDQMSDVRTLDLLFTDTAWWRESVQLELFGEDDVWTGCSVEFGRSCDLQCRVPEETGK